MLPIETKYSLRRIGGGPLLPGGLYRSADICAIDEADAQALLGLGVRTIYDLRRGWEVGLYPEPTMLGMRHVTVMPPEPNLGERRRNRLSPGEIGKLGPPGAEMLKSYRKMVREAPIYGRVLRSIAHEGVPALIHCTNGKDRVGVLSATVLRLCGASEADIVRDYLTTNTYNAERNARDFVRLGADMSADELQILTSFFEARAEYLQAHFDAVDEAYGSFEAYVREGLGLDERDCERLRELCVAQDAPRRSRARRGSASSASWQQHWQRQGCPDG